jgi:hypothetical protein
MRPKSVILRIIVNAVSGNNQPLRFGRTYAATKWQCGTRHLAPQRRLNHK